MTVQMLFNPNILEFWQVMMGMRRESVATLEASEENRNSNESESKESLRQLWQKTQRHHPSKVIGRPTQGMFDKLAIPSAFEGKTFRELFGYLLNRYGTVALGLYRSNILFLPFLFFPEIQLLHGLLVMLQCCP